MSHPRRPGRPRKAIEERRTIAVMVRLSPEEATRVAESARVTGLSTPAYLRSLGLRRTVRAAVPIVDLQLLGELQHLGRNFNQALVLAYTGRAPTELLPIAEAVLQRLGGLRDAVVLRHREEGDG